MGRQVILAETVPLFRCGVRSTLERAGGWTVLEAATMVDILELAQGSQPDCAILDCAAHTFDALETCWMLRQQVPTIGLVILAPTLQEEQLFQYFIRGANAYQPRSITPEALLDQVQRVSRGEFMIESVLLAGRPPTRSEPGRDSRPRVTVPTAGTEHALAPSPLSAREVEILQWIAWGNSNKQIGQALKISDQTVKNHITSTLKKLSVNDRTAAVMYAISRHWISMEGPEVAQRAKVASR